MANPSPEPRKETLLIGVVFVLLLAPVLALDSLLTILAVSRYGSNRVSLSVIALLIAVTILAAAVVEHFLLRLPFKRCLREAAAAGWGILPPSLFVYFWNLPKSRQMPQFIIALLIIIVWLIFFWRVFSANTAASRRDRRS